ncbi:hypothetical protein DB30_00771 [Enhygromyxa salina]|uniref:Uncharacterized protein n=1 Tax=Enhygromyxa salina TaxID=215803 RepID=A0A0C2D5M2_9BACT|nr:hypothetical protein DB30_00771 [Enhygromyxa salina]
MRCGIPWRPSRWAPRVTELARSRLDQRLGQRAQLTKPAFVGVKTEYLARAHLENGSLLRCVLRQPRVCAAGLGESRR